MVCVLLAPGAEAAVAQCSARARKSAPPPSDALETGMEVELDGIHYKVTELLGQGSFGEVWGAVGHDGRLTAIKEITCRTDVELACAEAEGEALELAHAGGPNAASAGKVPRLLASKVDSPQPGTWRVRLAMTLLPGEPLEQMLRVQRKTGSHWSFLQACEFAGTLLRQLQPVLEDLNARLYHRDVTTRNILVEDHGGSTERRFTLVDFGLAMHAEQWQASSSGGAVSIAGDGRYWPSSAWLGFERGVEELGRNPELLREYQTRLDFHALGITALRCLLELWRAPQELKVGGGMRGNCGDECGELAPRLRVLWAAWKKYWSDAGRFWQPVYDVFGRGGDFDKLKSAYMAAGVHRTIRDDLQALHRALHDVRATYGQSTPSPGGPVARGCGPAELFDTLLHLISGGTGGSEDDCTAAEPQVRQSAATDRSPYGPLGGQPLAGPSRVSLPLGGIATAGALAPSTAGMLPLAPRAAWGAAQSQPARGEWLLGSPTSQSTGSPHSPFGALSTPHYASPVSPFPGPSAIHFSGSPLSPFPGSPLSSYAGSPSAVCLAQPPLGWFACAAGAQVVPAPHQQGFHQPAGVWVGGVAPAPMVSGSMACTVLVPAGFPAF